MYECMLYVSVFYHLLIGVCISNFNDECYIEVQSLEAYVLILSVLISIHLCTLYVCMYVRMHCMYVL